MQTPEVQQVGECVWEIAPRDGMQAPVRLYASEKMLDEVFADKAPEQAMNVARLPGIVGASLAMPDMHWGYGFPIGGVAAFDLDEGVVSPGGVGYDINCGVRLLASDLSRADLEPRRAALADALFGSVPSGVGAGGRLDVSSKELRQVAEEGAAWAVKKGYGRPEDLEYIEEGGRMEGADPVEISPRAWERGQGQVGTLGSGNHFLEVGVVEEVFDREAARAFGLRPDQITVMIHCGSRGFGHQVCEDFLGRMDQAARAYGIALPDRQLACAPVMSPEGQSYLQAMRCAVNYAFANRQVIAHFVREAFAKALRGLAGADSLRTVYEVAHNIAKIETHAIEGRRREVCVHRKGATRAFGPGCGEVPAAYRAAGQPVLVPGDMGRCSYVLAGTAVAMEETFGSACHGAGRRMSRHAAIQKARGRFIERELASRGIGIKAKERQTLAEEMPEAYKDVTEVVDVCERAGLARKVARLRPLNVIKG